MNMAKSEPYVPDPRMQHINNLPDLATREQIADFLQVSPDWVNQRMTTGEIPSAKIGGNRRIPKADLLKFLGIEHQPSIDLESLSFAIQKAVEAAFENCFNREVSQISFSFAQKKEG